MKHEGLELYARTIDCNNGYQEVIVEDGIIIKQQLISRTAGHYTGVGNPELIGKNIDIVKRKYHLHKVYLSENAYNAIQQQLIDELRQTR